MPGFIQSGACRFLKRQRGYSGQIAIIFKLDLRSFWVIPLLFTTIWGDQPAGTGRYNLPRIIQL